MFQRVQLVNLSAASNTFTTASVQVINGVRYFF
jgi:hypothetical protein